MATSGRHSMSYTAEHALRTIFKRCVQCPDTTPSCPTCKSDQICSLVPQTCDSCSYMTCIANPSPAPKNPGPNVGAIAGGVVGGVVAVAIVVYLIWRFWIKKRREQQELEADEWFEDEAAHQKGIQQFNAMHSDAVSTRTRGSIANSFLSRASNIIQIAYIPGVTNRNGSGHNSILSSAPVPPIPAAMRGTATPKSPLSNEGDALFFRPGDLRDSTYSDASSFMGNNRDTQYTRQSITPSLARSSVASDVYRDDATQVPMPATTVMRATPHMVSVKSSPGSSPMEFGEPSPVSSSNHSQFAANTPSGKGIQIMMPGQGSAPAASQRVKAKQVTLGSKGRFPVRHTSDTSSAPSSGSKHAPAVSSPLAEVDNEDDSDEPQARTQQSLVDVLEGSSGTSTVQPAESPFFDASERQPASSSSRPNPYATMGSTISAAAEERPKRKGKAAVGGLSAVIEEATKRASRVPSHEGLGGKHDASPFGDEHSTD